MHLVDINVWLALIFEAHQHHPQALRWFDAAEPDSCAMCRLAQNGLLRLATNPAVFADEAVTMAQAWALYDELLADERVYYLAEPQGLEATWRDYTRDQTHSSKVWSDAYLAAFAVAAGMGVLSFDKGFQKFDGLALTIPV
ncbi:MAG: PIN domain-containing protein [Candidatus Latescibacteria bacterium]|nr:PIN domain-containing protein [Candidatus Latescibacterota bacterium]